MVLCFGFALGATAAEGETTLVSESEFFADIPLVDTVTRLPQPKSETPAAVTIIDRDMIRASGVRNLADVFRLVPGFQVAYSRGEIPSVTYHGLGDTFSRRMQILIDGRSAYGAFIGNVSWSSLAVAVEDIERIEITRGPNTVAHGANAFLGAINIITGHAAQSHGAAAKLTAGDHAIRDGLARLGTRFDGGDIRLTAGYLAEDGLGGLPDDFRTRSVNVRADLRPTSRDTVLAQLGIARANPVAGFDGSALFPPTQTEATSHFEQIRWQRRFAVDNEFSIQLSHHYLHLDFNALTDPIPLGPPFGRVRIPVSNDGKEHRYDLEFQHTLSPRADWRWVWGGGAREDRAESEPFFSNPEPVKNRSSRLFGNAEGRVAQDAIVNVGAMWEHTDFTGTDFSPRLALNYHLNPDHTLRTAWSKARRIPSLFEERGDRRLEFQGVLLDHIFASQGGLRSETMTSSEVGYLGRIPGARLTLDARLYRDRISDFITHVTVPAVDPLNAQAFSFRNEGEVTVDGVDMELAYRPSRDSRVVLAYARMRASAGGFSSDAVLDRRSVEDSVPNYSGSLFAMHRFLNEWYASLGYYWVDKMLWMRDLPLGTQTVDSYTRLDLRLARRLRLGDTRGELALVVQNAGHKYEDFRQDQFFERRVFATFRLDL